MGAGGPLETTKLTFEPFSTLVPAGGSCRITNPAGTVVLISEVTAPSLSFAAAIASSAATGVMFVRSGTVACGSPLLTQ